MIGLFMADGESFLEGEILDAEIIPTNSSRRELNFSALSTIAVSVVFLLFGPKDFLKPPAIVVGLLNYFLRFAALILHFCIQN